MAAPAELVRPAVADH